MSLLKANAVQLGQSLTASQNFTLYQPAIPDGTFFIANGNSASPTNLITVGSTGNLTFTGTTETYTNSVTISAASTKTLTLNGGAGSNGLVLDASNNVGIGTATPATKLEVYGSTTGLKVTGASSTAAFFQATSAGVQDWSFGTRTTGKFVFNTGNLLGGTDVLILDSSGNLGLGVTPSAWGTWSSILQGNAYALTGYNATGNVQATLWCNSYANSGGTNTYYSNGFASRYTQGFGAHQWFTAASGTAGNAISFTQAMTLDASGYLNIGNTSNAGAPLQVQVSRTSSTNAVALILSDLVTGIQTNGVYKAIRSISNNGASISEIRFLETDGTNNNTGIAFATATSAASCPERARIDYSGNLLVGGTTSPAAGISGSILVESATGGIGYFTGSGGAITQITSRTTGVTLNKPNGAITLVSAAGLATYQTFTVTNSTVAATDVIHVCQKSGTDKYIILVTAVATGSFAITFATTGGVTTEQPVFNFAVIKAVTA